MNANLDKLCFQIKDILRNYGKQQTAEGTMTAEVIMEYLIFLKFFEPYSPKLHGEKRLKVYDRMIENYPNIKTFSNIMTTLMATATDGTLSFRKSITEQEMSTMADDEFYLHKFISENKPTSEIFDGTMCLADRLKDNECLLKIFQVLYLSDFRIDDVGDIHEYFIQDEAKQKSKMYGQFFTPNEICMKALDNVNPSVKEDGSMPSFMDPTAGSFKFMRNVAKRLAKSTGNSYRDILLNNCHGCEIETKAYKALQYNILMETGDISNNVYNANSLKYLRYGKLKDDKCQNNLPEYDTEKRYDYIFANPPFGCKAELDMYVKEYVTKKMKGGKEKREPIHGYLMKTRNSDGMFIQLIIHLLKEEGEACIVLCGSIFNKELSALRQHWLETCNLKSITVCPKNIFKNTSIETYLFHFKKGEPTKEIVYYNFDGSEIGRRSEFSDVWDIGVPKIVIERTKHVFTQYKLKDICDISVGYTPNSKDEANYKDGTNTWVTIADMTKLNGDKYISDSKEKITTTAIKTSKMAKQGSLLVSFKLTVGKTAICACDLYHNEAIACINTKDTSIVSNIYLYHLLTALDWKGQSKKNIYNADILNKETLSVIDLNIPSIQVQNEFIDYLDSLPTVSLRVVATRVFNAGGDYENICKKLEALDKNIELTKAKIEANKEYMKILLEVETEGCEKVRLGDVCKVSTGKVTTKAKLEEGDIPVYGGGIKPMSFTNTHTHDKGTIVILRDGANAGYVHRLCEQAFLTGSANYIHEVSNMTSESYIYYVLKYTQQQDLIAFQGNPTAQPHVHPHQIVTLEIPLLNVEKQQMIVELFDAIEKANTNALQQIERIEDLKKRVIDAQLS